MKYIVTNDIHLGHLKTPIQHIINSFKVNILSEQNKNIDILFIAGDLFDRLLDLNSKEVHYIIDFFNYILSYCFSNNILLRILEGTPSHDFQQSQILLKLNEIRTNKCNLKYFNKLDIEYIEQFNKYVLYIPDEWTNSNTELKKQISIKLNSLSISQVDIAILHGQFKYQLATAKYKGFYYNEDYFLSLVKGYVHIGHYHNHTTYDRIIATGSLERLAHGEENPKGYVIVNNSSYSFIENTYSYIYKTLNITPSYTIDKLDSKIFKYPVNSYIRLLVSKDHPFNITFQELKLRYLDYNLKKIIKEHITENNSISYILSESDLELSDRYVIDTDIYKTVLDIILSKYQLDSLENSKLLKYIEPLKEILHEQDTGE